MPQVKELRRNTSRGRLIPAAKSANALAPGSPHMGYGSWVHPAGTPSSPNSSMLPSSRASSTSGGMNRLVAHSQAPATPAAGRGRLVCFKAEVETQWGDSVVIVGSTNQLGNWTPRKGIALSTDETTYPVWHLRNGIDMGEQCDVEYKLVILRAARDGQPAHEQWEEIGESPLENRQLKLGLEAPAEVRLTLRWGTQRTLVHCKQPPPGALQPSPLSRASSLASTVMPDVGATPPCASALQPPAMIRATSGMSIMSDIDMGEAVLGEEALLALHRIHAALSLIHI